MEKEARRPIASASARGSRTCRACGRPYEYPVPRGAATRFYCAACTTLDEPVRRVVARLQRQIRRLSVEVDKLAARVDAAGRTGRDPAR
ncbi:MAG: hypothetical protein HYX76_16140 [Acidobacteria bacterium]|nr:hypothetical protein [Acidobacteriota bacterium]